MNAREGNVHAGEKFAIKKREKSRTDQEDQEQTNFFKNVRVMGTELQHSLFMQNGNAVLTIKYRFSQCMSPVKLRINDREPI